MRMMRTAGVLALVLVVSAGCGRKNLPVPLSSQGDNPRPIAITPDPQGLARAPGIAPIASDSTVTPREVTRNPNARERPFLLDGLLN